MIIPWLRAFKLTKNEISHFILEESKKKQQLNEFIVTHCFHLLDMNTIDSGIPCNILDMVIPAIGRENPVICTST